MTFLTVRCTANSRSWARTNICLRSDSSGWYVRWTFHPSRWWEPTACSILILTRRLQKRLWIVGPLRLVSYCTNGQGCVAPSIHVPDARNGLCLTVRRYKPIYVFVRLFTYTVVTTVSKCKPMVVMMGLQRIIPWAVQGRKRPSANCI